MGNIDRSYQIADPGIGGYWRCGHASGGKQVFVYGRSDPRLRQEITSIIFDRDGNLLGSQSVAVPPSHPSGGPGWQDAAESALKTAMTEWLARIEFRAGTITIRRFSCEDVLIEDLPSLYREFITNPGSSEWKREGAETMRQRIERWKANNRYVLVFGDEIWMDSDCTVEST